MDGLGHLDEPQLAVLGDHRQLHGVGRIDQRLRQRAIEGPSELDDETARALGRQRLHEALLALDVAARAEAGREDELAAAQQIGGILHIEDVHPADVPAQRLLPGDDLGEAAGERRQLEHLGHCHPTRMAADDERVWLGTGDSDDDTGLSVFQVQSVAAT